MFECNTDFTYGNDSSFLFTAFFSSEYINFMLPNTAVRITMHLLHFFSKEYHDYAFRASRRVPLDFLPLFLTGEVKNTFFQ